MTRTTILILFGVALAVLGGCNFGAPPEDAIAIVGREALTPDQVTARLEDMGLDPDDENLRAQVVNQWVDRQIMLHEARRRDLDRNEEIRERVEALRDELMIRELLDQAVHVSPPDDDDVVAYWRDHTGEFTRVTDEVRLVLAYTTSRSMGWVIRNGIDQSKTGKELSEQYSNTRFDTTGYVSVERLPRQISRAIEPLRTEQASLPFSMNGQWMVAKLLDRAKQGRTRPVDEMMPLIRAQMMGEMKARQEMAYIEGLRREARRHGTVRINVPSDMVVDREGLPVDTVAADTMDTETEEE